MLLDIVCRIIMLNGKYFSLTSNIYHTIKSTVLSFRFWLYFNKFCAVFNCDNKALLTIVTSHGVCVHENCVILVSSAEMIWYQIVALNFNNIQNALNFYSKYKYNFNKICVDYYFLFRASSGINTFKLQEP